MIKEKVYEYFEKYLNKYLIGFDKSQLAVAIMSGSIELKSVNLNPISINRLFEKYKLPFALKAGSIGKFQFKVITSRFIHPACSVTSYPGFLIHLT